MKYQLLHVQFDHISDHKHDIYFYRKLSTKLLAQAANKNTKFMFTKTGRMLFSYFFFPTEVCRSTQSMIFIHY